MKIELGTECYTPPLRGQGNRSSQAPLLRKVLLQQCYQST